MYFASSGIDYVDEINTLKCDNYAAFKSRQSSAGEDGFYPRHN